MYVKPLALTRYTHAHSVHLRTHAHSLLRSCSIHTLHPFTHSLLLTLTRFHSLHCLALTYCTHFHSLPYAHSLQSLSLISLDPTHCTLTTHYTRFLTTLHLFSHIALTPVIIIINVNTHITHHDRRLAFRVSYFPPCHYYYYYHLRPSIVITRYRIATCERRF